MTTMMRNRTDRWSRLGALLTTMVLVLMLAPGAAAGMQKVPETVIEPTPIFLDSELREKVNTMPWDSAEEDEVAKITPEAVEDIGGSFVDTTFGFTVEFPGPWSHTGAHEEDGVVTEFLEIRGEQGGIYVTAYEWTGEYAVREYIQWWATAEYSEEWLPGGQSLRYTTGGSQGAVIHISAPTDEYPERWVYVTELHEFNGYVVEIVHFAPLSTFEESYNSVAQTLFADGTSVLGIFTYEEIEALLPAQ